MELFKEDLLKAKEFMKRCKEREVMKKYLVLLNFLGISFISIIELHKQIKDTIGVPYDMSFRNEFIEIWKNIDHLLLKDPKRFDHMPSVKDCKEACREEVQYGPIPMNTEEPSIDCENGRAFCNFDAACSISAIIQKAVQLV